MVQISADSIDAIRGFNRFYTRQLGLLDEGLLQSDYSLTEARILYELAHGEHLTATDVRDLLGLDAGYLSRVLTGLEKRKLIRRSVSESDARQSHLSLTSKGREAFHPLDRASRAQISGMIGALSPVDVRKLVESMRTIERLLVPPPALAVPYILRPLQIGDIGWITHRQALLYAAEHGLDETFEALAAEIQASFVRTFDPKWECCWVVERDDTVVGSVFLVRGSADVARLRLLYVEPSARGLGIGRRLVNECVNFARRKGYRTLTLWTNSILVSACRIYQAAGLQLVKEESHHSFGRDLVGQTWELALQCPARVTRDDPDPKPQDLTA